MRAWNVYGARIVRATVNYEKIKCPKTKNPL